MYFHHFNESGGSRIPLRLNCSRTMGILLLIYSVRPSWHLQLTITTKGVNFTWSELGRGNFLADMKLHIHFLISCSTCWLIYLWLELQANIEMKETPTWEVRPLLPSLSWAEVDLWKLMTSNTHIAMMQHSGTSGVCPKNFVIQWCPESRLWMFEESVKKEREKKKKKIG